MPGDNIVKHPNKSHIITFTESDHSYIDNYGKKYMSVTTIVGNAFPKFETDKIAEQCAKKRGVKKEDLIKEWVQKGKEATRLGTRLHENMEYYIHKNFDLMHTPENLIEKIKFDGAIKILDNIVLKYKPKLLEPEKLVFSPTFGIAGSIDLLVKIDEFNYIIFDWKCLSKDIEKESYMGKTGHILPTLNILDCNFWHYALQLQIYENILKSEDYISINANVKKCLIVWNGEKFKIEKIPYVPEAWALMLWRQKMIQ
jgi:ATP-dependent exoDNAse (exonuclease V) beta subunit